MEFQGKEVLVPALEEGEEAWVDTRSEEESADQSKDGGLSNAVNVMTLSDDPVSKEIFYLWHALLDVVSYYVLFQIF